MQTWSPPSMSSFGIAFAFTLSQDPRQWCLVPILALSQCHVCFRAWLGSLVLPCPLLCTPSTAFAFALSWDLGGSPIPSPSLGAAFARSGSLVVVLWAHSPSSTHSWCCCACLPSLAHSWCHVCSVGMLGSGAMCLLALSHTLPAPLCLLALSCTLLVLCLLSRDPWWWHCVPVLALSCALPCLADAKGGQAKGSQPVRGTHLRSSTEQGTGQDSERKLASNGHSRIVKCRARD
jgi:hypothetical protein